MSNDTSKGWKEEGGGEKRSERTFKSFRKSHPGGECARCDKDPRLESVLSAARSSETARRRVGLPGFLAGWLDGWMSGLQNPAESLGAVRAKTDPTGSPSPCPRPGAPWAYCFFVVSWLNGRRSAPHPLLPTETTIPAKDLTVGSPLVHILLCCSSRV